MLSEEYDIESVNKSTVFEWNAWFKEDKDTVEDTEKMWSSENTQI